MILSTYLLRYGRIRFCGDPAPFLIPSFIRIGNVFELSTTCFADAVPPPPFRDGNPTIMSASDDISWRRELDVVKPLPGAADFDGFGAPNRIVMMSLSDYGMGDLMQKGIPNTRFGVVFRVFVRKGNHLRFITTTSRAPGAMIELETPMAQRMLCHPFPGPFRNGFQCGGVPVYGRTMWIIACGDPRQQGIGDLNLPLVVADDMGAFRVEPGNGAIKRASFKIETHPVVDVKLQSCGIRRTVNRLLPGAGNFRDHPVGYVKFAMVVADNGRNRSPFLADIPEIFPFPMMKFDPVGYNDLRDILCLIFFVHTFFSISFAG